MLPYTHTWPSDVPYVASLSCPAGARIVGWCAVERGKCRGVRKGGAERHRGRASKGVRIMSVTAGGRLRAVQLYGRKPRRRWWRRDRRCRAWAERRLVGGVLLRQVQGFGVVAAQVLLAVLSRIVAALAPAAAAAAVSCAPQPARKRCVGLVQPHTAGGLCADTWHQCVLA